MPLTLYFDLLSQPARTVYIFLKTNNIPFEEKYVSLMKAEQKGKEFMALNPVGTLPFIDDNGFKLSESVAIAKYIATVHNVPEHWYPKDVKKQARVEEFLRWYPSNVRGACSSILLELIVFPKVRGTTPDEEKVEQLRERVRTVLGALESYFLGDKKFIAGDEVSLADLFGVCEIVQLYGCNEQGLYQESSIVNAWIERVKQATNPHFDGAMTGINDMHDNYVGAQKK